MSKLRAPLFLLCLCLSLAGAHADPAKPPALIVDSQGEFFEYSLTNGVFTLSNNVIIRIPEKSTVLTANRATVNTNTGDILAEGSVHLQREDQSWAGERLHYNYLTTDLEGGEFRTGRPFTFASGEVFAGNHTNNTYNATNGFVTVDDYFRPLIKVRTSHMKIVPGEYVEAHNAVLYAGKVPLFYFPYYRRNLGENNSNFSFLPGYRSAFGPFLLSGYHWWLNDYMEGTIHADYREKRGFGGGPDLGFHFGDYGDGILKYYFTHDHDPGEDGILPIPPENRQRAYFGYFAQPITNLTFNAQVAWWSDPLVTHDFFESEYKKDVQPQTFVEGAKLWPNWDLDTLAQVRVNDFFDTVERLPDVRLTGLRQQVFDTPLFYESESSIGWYQRVFSDTNNPAIPSFSASRADTFQQFTLPENFFGWLNVTPRAGGRFTWYSEAEGPGATTTEHYRGVFNTGAEVSTKLSRTWTDVHNDFFDLDGLRHIIEPSINYVYVPRPNVLPSQLPQFDYAFSNTLYLPPIEFPDFNSIDSIDSQNVIRYGLRNRLQTKRGGQVEDVVNWGLYTDWRLRPNSDQTTFSDIFSDLELRPRRWLTFNSQSRFDPNTERFNYARTTLTLAPNNVWSWSVGDYYVRQGPLSSINQNFFTSLFYYRFGDNWGARMAHQIDAHSGTLQEQYYTLYRDLRSWTAALTFRVQDNSTRGKDYTIALTFSFKAFPRFSLGQDTISGSTLVGY